MRLPPASPIFCVSPKPYLDRHGYDVQTIRHLFRALREMGIGGVHLASGTPQQDVAWRERTAHQVAVAGEEGLLLALHGPMGDISSVHPQVREAALAAHRQALTAIGSLAQGVTYVVHPESGCPTRQPGDAQAREALCRQGLVELLPLAQAYEARLALENMRSRADNPQRTGMFTDQLTDILQGLDEQHLGICFDVGHALISEGEGLYDAFLRNADRIIHIHLDDNRGVEDEHLELGLGLIDWTRFYAAIQASGYAGLLELEVGPRDGEDPLPFYQRNYAHFTRMSSAAGAAPVRAQQ